MKPMEMAVAECPPRATFWAKVRAGRRERRSFCSTPARHETEMTGAVESIKGPLALSQEQGERADLTQIREALEEQAFTLVFSRGFRVGDETS